MKILVTGGAGFVGASLSLHMKRDWPSATVIAFDNLRRRGSELNLERLRLAGVKFVHGDVRHAADLSAIGPIDLLLECSAEPSVLGGLSGDARYVIDTNLIGTVNCLEYARTHGALVMFFSTSRVFPIGRLTMLPVTEIGERLTLLEGYHAAGVSSAGISEEFPLGGSRSLYGATKLASELLIEEYGVMFGLRTIVNRCGLLTGPWQMGKVDQGVVALWVACHYFGKPLKYIGFGGAGKQVRDFLHVDDLYRLVRVQIQSSAQHVGHVYNVGGGSLNSFSLAELTDVCRSVVGKRVEIDSVVEDRVLDIPWFITDSRKVQAAAGWSPEIGLHETVRGITNWIQENEKVLSPVFL
ncbi:putative CDP tyvulose epimerase [Nitrospira lenta]|uniref:Putative CDP tyvulose epimerase n=2 Tax=Nitrospira lenta TaxID=1436998 RepID=A0A330L7I0_9BACT|nr:NAD-dependent epimerase/dehydratase family protein [Nitrospira lenta]SPP65632.1 putative CDP tyvulose epimerase [Nitrospira lenta]